MPQKQQQPKKQKYWLNWWTKKTKNKTDDNTKQTEFTNGARHNNNRLKVRHIFNVIMRYFFRCIRKSFFSWNFTLGWVGHESSEYAIFIFIFRWNLCLVRYFLLRRFRHFTLCLCMFQLVQFLKTTNSNKKLKERENRTSFIPNVCGT